MKTAIILGATGLTGGLLLQELLNDQRYGKIKLFSRSKVAVKNEKIEEYLVNLFKLEDHKEDFKADEVFCCIGTTKSKTPDKDTYRKIDHGIPVKAAKISKENGIERYLVISALGADEKSKMFYNKTKGEMEKDVLSQNIKNTFVFRPALIAGDRVEKRFFEKLAKKAMKVLDYAMVGPLRQYSSIHPQTIAKAMVIVANKGYSKTVIPSDEIKNVVAEAEK